MISAVAVTPDSRYIIGGHGYVRDHPGHITFWDFKTGSLVRNDNWAYYELKELLITPDCRSVVVSGREDHTYHDGIHYLVTGDIESGEYKIIRAATDFPLDISFSWDKRYVKFGDYVWNWQKGGNPFMRNEEAQYDGRLHPKVVELTREHVLTSDDESYYIKDIRTNAVVRKLKGNHYNEAHALTPCKVSMDNRYLFAQRGSRATKDEILCMWDLQTGAFIKFLESCRGGIRAIDITSDNQFIVAAIGFDPRSAMIVVDIQTDEVVLKIEHE